MVQVKKQWIHLMNEMTVGAGKRDHLMSNITIKLFKTEQRSMKERSLKYFGQLLLKTQGSFSFGQFLSTSYTEHRNSQFHSVRSQAGEQFKQVSSSRAQVETVFLQALKYASTYLRAFTHMYNYFFVCICAHTLLHLFPYFLQLQFSLMCATGVALIKRYGKY